ncbi:uncharacterized protein LOC129596284 [Paramacrobiotus metropolitanus]|uniref:uncharacterized protein LOC129596284 n=1 Tax=Paramacrobiotus metropolitanus TaxID=2943436 RepID=UPI002445B101|nr:uncharacterized protein LOC129596284 [Paramacrobiotus metropolitanus]XP_055349496.1 uncharacterized protein LOC129596284 [Paramacrobiotus metropolitanus]
MGIKTFLTKCLDKEVFLSYPEILTEAILVLWFACQVCLKFGLRVLPEWHTSRTDPDAYNSFDYLLELFGHKVNACFWDDVMSGWMPPHPLTVNHSVSDNLDVTHPPASNITLGYVIALVTVILTAVLSVSLLFLVLVNRHRPSSVLKDHLRICHEWAEFLQDYSRVLGKIGLQACMTNLLFAVSGAVIFVICYVGWIIYSAVPVVLVAGLAVALPIAVCGPTAVFPCCIFFANISTVYCAGRIWGLWMNQTCFALIKKGIRKLNTANHPAKLSSIAPLVKKAFARPDEYQRQRYWEKVARSFLAFWLGCVAVYHNVWPLYERFPTVVQSRYRGANWTYWHLVNSTGTCSKYGTHFDQETAMLSYWVDLQSEELLAFIYYNVSTAELLFSFTPPFSPAVGWTFMVWCRVLSGASGTPLNVLESTAIIVIGTIDLVLLGALVYLVIRACYNKWRQHVVAQRKLKATDRDNSSQPLTVNLAAAEAGIPGSAQSARLLVPSNKAMDSFTRSDNPQEPVIADHKLPEGKSEHGARGSIVSKALKPEGDRTSCFCICVVIENFWLLVLVAHCSSICLVLPFSLVGLFLPERLQLPGFLLLLTMFTVWMYHLLVKSAWHACCYMRSIKTEHKGGCIGGVNSLATTESKHPLLSPPME